MSNKDFVPYGARNKSFNPIDYKGDQTPEVNPQVELLDECEELRQTAKKQGYEEGYATGAHDIQELKKELSYWINQVKNPVQMIDDHITQEMIQTIIWICQYCMGVELSVHPDKLRELIDRIKEELPSLQSNKVFAMHPDDVEWVKKHIHEKEIPGLHEILYADTSLNRGDFYLKSPHSELDGRLHTRLITLFAKYIDKDNLIPPISSD